MMKTETVGGICSCIRIVEGKNCSDDEDAVHIWKFCDIYIYI